MEPLEETFVYYKNKNLDEFLGCTISHCLKRWQFLGQRISYNIRPSNLSVCPWCIIKISGRINVYIWKWIPSLVGGYLHLLKSLYALIIHANDVWRKYHIIALICIINLWLALLCCTYVSLIYITVANCRKETSQYFREIYFLTTDRLLQKGVMPPTDIPFL